MLGSYKDLRVWNCGMKLAMDVYGATVGFPKHEMYGLANQMRRAAVSVPSNIAEGKGHRSDAEFRHFLFHARGSLLELETQVTLASQLKYLRAEDSTRLLQETADVAKSLNALINSLDAEGQRRTTNGERRTTNRERLTTND